VEEALDRVALAEEARDRKPTGLSGGQQQRVALARALVIEPDLLLLDEPLANLDRRLREQVRGELRQLQRSTGLTTLLVTHDQEEALALADRVGVMAAGRLLQAAAPEELYERPCCPYVARLLGDANLLAVEHAGPDALTLAGGFRVSPVPRTLQGAVAGDVILVRPGVVRLGAVAGVSATGRVLDVSYRGDHAAVDLLVGQVRLAASVEAHQRPRVGDEVPIVLPHEAMHLLPQRDPPGLVT
jgi:ABC-type Fe3+/spermidine/putrescine transport system ATPase subunit